MGCSVGRSQKLPANNGDNNYNQCSHFWWIETAGLFILGNGTAKFGHKPHYLRSAHVPISFFIMPWYSSTLEEEEFQHGQVQFTYGWNESKVGVPIGKIISSSPGILPAEGMGEHQFTVSQIRAGRVERTEIGSHLKPITSLDIMTSSFLPWIWSQDQSLALASHRQK